MFAIVFESLCEAGIKLLGWLVEAFWRGVTHLAFKVLWAIGEDLNRTAQGGNASSEDDQTNNEKADTRK